MTHDDAPIGRDTPVCMRKYDGTFLRRFPTRFVSRVGPLYLLSLPAGAPITRTADPAADPAPIAARGGHVYMFDDRWWNAIRVLRDGRTWYYVNIASPAEFDGASFACIDLDLDVSWYPDGGPSAWDGDGHPGGPRVLDEDEFLAHSASMRYPPVVVQRARAAVDEVLDLIQRRAFPFDQHDHP